MISINIFDVWLALSVIYGFSHNKLSVNAFLNEMKLWENIFPGIYSQKNTGDGASEVQL